mgnify:CR=1 FL=1
MHSWLEKIAAKRVLVIGDIMLDRYYFADVTRISPEGPVPVAKVKESMFCPQCGAKVNQGDVFCSKCGTRVV